VTVPYASLGGAGPPVWSPYATQPFNRIVWPHEAWAVAEQMPLVWDAATARKLPSVARALQVYTGMSKQMPMDAYRGIQPLPRPRLLEQPDPTRGRGWFVQVQIEDYLLHGNALALITARDPAGWPTAVAWIPAYWCALVWDPRDPAAVEYRLRWDMSTKLDERNVIHVRRGADPWCPPRGVGVVEEQLRTLDKVGRQDEYERSTMAGAAIPSVAVVTPNPRLSQEEADEGKATWMEKYGGVGRRPGIFPAGTVVTPLSWSPSDSQLVEARQQSLVDVANMFNLDGYWLGAPGATMTYKSPGPMYLNLIRMSINPVLGDFEDVWSSMLLPRGQRVAFDRAAVLGEDFLTTMAGLKIAVETGLNTRDEARVYLNLPVLGGAIPQVGPLAPPLAEPDDAALLDADSAADGDDPAALDPVDPGEEQKEVPV
jgi:HK97 family phage portal protein